MLKACHGLPYCESLWKLHVNHDDVGADLAKKNATKTQEALKCIDDEATVEASKCCGTRCGTFDEQNSCSS